MFLIFFAHGYECLSKKCIVLYHLDNYRDAKNEDGIKFNDKKLKIKWFTKKPLISIGTRKSNSFEYFEKKIKTLKFMKLALIVIFCYNRPYHLKKTLNSLKKK